MRPCDCVSEQEVKNLTEQGVAFNNKAITVSPLSVILVSGSCTIRIPMKVFQVFAEWYLKDQK
jgi:hypothetical protein